MKSYTAFEALVAPARARRGVLRLLSGAILIAFLYMAFLMIWTVFTASLLPIEGGIREALRGTTFWGMVIVMGGFATMILALFMVLNVLHKRDLASLVGPRPAALTQAWAVGRLCIPLILVIWLIPMPGEDEATSAMALPRWIALLPLSFLLLAIQCGAEELVFRGYLQSQLAADYRSPLIWMGVPSLIFGYLHYAPDLYGDAAFWVAAWAVVFGALMADITARAGTLGPAIIIHMLNNFMSLSVMGFADDLGGMALYHLPHAPDDAEVMMALMPLEFLSMVCMWLTARIALRR
ncbi:MAG: CPBP family intramembrane metalloprotease [Shimia sp.]|nr:CPBP family intramembrane metalloprotease [Shimia sp.]